MRALWHPDPYPCPGHEQTRLEEGGGFCGPGIVGFGHLTRSLAPAAGNGGNHRLGLVLRPVRHGTKALLLPQEAGANLGRPGRNSAINPSPPRMEFPGKSCSWSAGCQRPEAGFLTAREQSGWPAQETAAFSALARTAANRIPLQNPVLPRGHRPSLFRPPRSS